MILQGDALTKLKELPDKSVNMCMTSPPYWALRDYGDVTSGTIWGGDENCEHDFSKNSFCKKCGAWKGQLGLEPTFNLYINNLCDVFDGVKRVLRDDGTCWVNIGDTYASQPAGNKGHIKNELFENTPKGHNFRDKIAKGSQAKGNMKGYTDKCLVMIPMRFAIEMINRGWILRNTIIWHKPNCMPSSVKDRFTVDFEYIFLFSKKKNYYFETQKEPAKTKSSASFNLRVRDVKRGYANKSGQYKASEKEVEQYHGQQIKYSSMRNKRAMWSICPKPFKEAHFAVYPEELCETPIKAGCPEFVCVKCGMPKIMDLEIKQNNPEFNQVNGKESVFISKGGVRQTDNGSTPHFNSPTIKELGYKPTCDCNAGFTGGTVLDPFFGAGTTGLVALKQNKKYIGIELNPEYIKIAEARIKKWEGVNENS